MPPAPWALYQRLADQVPDGPVVVDAMVNRWAAVRTDDGAMGLAMGHDGGPRAGADEWDVVGRPLREVAALSMSWDLALASIGVAAMKSWYCSPERVASLPGVVLGDGTETFTRLADDLAGRRCVVVGHFPPVERLGDNVTVLERRPRGRDLPDPACEYVLPDAEVVLVSGSSLVNKTLPRLLELAAGAEVHLVGPSSPAADVWPSCVVDIAGSCVVDPEQAWHLAALGGRGLVHSATLQPFAWRPVVSHPAQWPA